MMMERCRRQKARHYFHAVMNSKENDDASVHKTEPTKAAAATPSKNDPALMSKQDVPAVKITDNVDGDNMFTIALDVPGYDSTNINITLDNGPENKTPFHSQYYPDAVILKISGTRSNRLYKATFEKKFRLRDSRLQLDELEAELVDGLLTITLPKKDMTKSAIRRSIPVRDASAENHHHAATSVAPETTVEKANDRDADATSKTTATEDSQDPVHENDADAEKEEQVETNAAEEEVNFSYEQEEEEEIEVEDVNDDDEDEDDDQHEVESNDEEDSEWEKPDIEA